MQARDATGRQVSLLNDDPCPRPSQQPLQRPALSASGRYTSATERSPLSTPELLRSDSYDSNASNYDAISPLTPSAYEYAPRSFYDDYSLPEKQANPKRPVYIESTSRSNSYEDDSASAAPERSGKRYPCRYRESHGCEKTFTTSGHASRHSKIHTAEKAVQCTFPGCHKKFTRADNMKQHLETHYKDKSRSSVTSKAGSKSHPSAAKRASISSRTSSHTSQGSPDVAMMDVDYYESQALPSPGTSWDMRSYNLPSISRPATTRSSSGLDALAAIACQEGP